MLKRNLFCLIVLFSVCVQAQINPNNNINNRLEDTLLDSLSNKEAQNIKLSGETKYTDYKIISYKNDTTYIDTTLTINKDYKFNFIRKDNFELMPFHNQGQTFNHLAYEFVDVSLYPELGARGKHFNFYEANDVNYYEVPTPITELAWQTGLEQGQFLDALISLNMSKRHNVSFAYKGLRSLGKYRNALSSNGNIRLTYSFLSKNNTYHLRTHIVAQDILNQENGGLTAESIVFFENDDPDFTDRGRLETNFTDASSVLRGNRYFIDHDYALWNRKNTINQRGSFLKIGHQFNYEVKHYEFDQTAANAIFGDAFTTTIKDKNDFTKFYNQLSVSLKSPVILGTLKLHIDNYDYDYRYKNVVVLNNETINQSLSGSVSSLGAEWFTDLKNISIHTKVATTFSGNLNANYFKATASYKKDSLFMLNATLLNSSKSANYNFLLNQSAYKNYNWKNTNFKNELVRTLLFELKSDKLLNASAQITQLDHHTYFSESLTNSQSKPLQYSGTINYLKVKASKTIKYGKFSLDNTLMYQKVANGSNVFRVPDFVTRNSFYYSNYLFKKKPLFLQTGITLKYFSSYFANAYNPLISEFGLQNEVEIGNFPLIDVFINAKVRQTRIYFKAEHLNSIFSPKDYYSAPNYPYRDFVIRFGLVWNFFI